MSFKKTNKCCFNELFKKTYINFQRLLLNKLFLKTYCFLLKNLILTALIPFGILKKKKKKEKRDINPKVDLKICISDLWLLEDLSK